MSTAAKFIFLHAKCLVRRPHNWRFHTAGIVREISRLEQQMRDGSAGAARSHRQSSAGSLSRT